MSSVEVEDSKLQNTVANQVTEEANEQDQVQIDDESQESKVDQSAESNGNKSKKVNLFCHYSSIDNLKSKGVLQAIRDQGHAHPSIEWTVAEKIHGCNFSFIVHPDGKTIQAAKRSGIIGGKESFHDHTSVQAELTEPLLQLASRFPGQQVTVYGELFGGLYNHPDVAKSKQKHIQKEVSYVNRIAFLAFDLRVGNPGIFVDHDVFEQECTTANVPYIKTLARGTFDELMQFDVETFQTTIPSYYGLPAIEHNYAEGVVLKPVIPRRFRTQSRVIIKKKRSTFDEIKSKKNNKPNQSVKQRVGSNATIDPVVEQWTQEVDTYVSENRLRNVLSKHSIGSENFKKIIGLFIQDCWLDFQKEHWTNSEDKPNNCDADQSQDSKPNASQIKQIKDHLSASCAELCNSNSESIVNGDF